MDLYNSFQQGIHIRGHYSWRVCERERERSSGKMLPYLGTRVCFHTICIDLVCCLPFSSVTFCFHYPVADNTAHDRARLPSKQECFRLEGSLHKAELVLRFGERPRKASSILVYVYGPWSLERRNVGVPWSCGCVAFALPAAHVTSECTGIA